MKYFTILLLMLVTVSFVNSQTNVSGTISSDLTWTLAGSPYIVVGSVTVNNGVTLTVDSSVVVRFTSGQALYVYGTMNASYTTFTSSKDTTGGSPAKGDWAYIQVGTSSAGSTTLDHCVIKYGGVSSPAYYASLYVYNGNATLNTCDINNSKNYGIILTSSATVTSNSTSISSCDWPISYSSPGSLVFNGINTLTGNTHNGIYLNFSSNANTFVLDTINVPYVLLSSYTVNSSGIFEIASSNVIKFGDYCYFYVDGTLEAIAGTGESVDFTTYRNDNIGGDTNGDGTATVPSPRIWGGIYFNNSSIDAACVLRRCNVTYGGYWTGGGINMSNASPTIDSCSMANNYYGVMMTGVSNPVFTNNTIGSSAMTPIAMSFSCNPEFSNNTFSFSDNTYDAIGLLGGTLPADAVIPIRSVTTVPNVTYVLLEDVIVPAGRTLTINKGVVIKGISYWNRLTIQGKLVANGTADSMITITSVKDDNFGGDTNKDGTSTSPARYDWGGILFESTSDSTSILNRCRLKYGTVPQYGQSQIATVGAHPTISNCEIKDVVYGVIAYQSSRVKLLNDTIVNAQYTPIAMSVSADPVMSGLSFINPGWNGIGLIGETVGLNGTIKQRDVAGYTNITYVLLGDLTISSGVNVTVDPGIVIKCYSGVGIWVNGGFKAKGTIAEGEIIFTDLRDDNVGNPKDTNGDGQASAPGRGYWATIRFQSTSDDSFCLLDSCQIKFNGNNWWGAVTFTDASSQLRNSLISNSYFYGIRCEGASIPIIDNLTISSCGYDPIAMSLTSDPDLTAITFEGNGSQGIRLLEGTLSSNATLHKRDVAGIENIAYIIQGLTISANSVLRIDPGVVMKSVADSWNGIWVNGALVAEGTATQKIVFTSIRDDSKGGDTNNDGNASSPTRWDWKGIAFNTSGLDTSNSLKNCEIRYGGSGAGSYWEYGELRFWGKAKVDSCAIEQTATSALGVYGNALPVITNCQLNNVSYTAVTMSMFSNPTFTNISAQNIGYMAIGVMPETYSVTATIPKRDLAGYSNITYQIMDYITINNGTTITIPNGVVFKGGRVIVNGGLIVQGTSLSPVVFTHVSDDSYGNPKDTESNGFTWPSIEWSLTRMSFSDISNDDSCYIRNTVFRYADLSVWVNQASPRISNCRFDRGNNGIWLDGVALPVVDSCVFHNLDRSPIYTSILSFPSSVVGNIVSGTTWRGIRIKDETLSQDFTLPKRSFAGFSNIPYIFGSFTVGTSSILSIEPGVVIKFEQYGALYVNKGLVAEGGSTTDSTIVFTSLRDDFYGGDTNADSNATSPWVEWWASVQFLNQALDSDCRVKYSVFRYGGYYWNGRGAIYTNSASPTITYCSFNQNRNALFITGASNPVINDCDIYQCTEAGVYNNDKTFNINAENNWWGDDTGPTHASNPGGKGVSVTDSVDFIPFTSHGSLRPKMGDVSLNGSIQAFDASLILKHVVFLDTLDAAQQAVADVSGASGITSFDASLILQYVVGLITTFPAEDSGGVTMPKAQQVLASSIELGSVESKFGSTVTVPIRFNDVRNLASADIVLKFNGDIFTPKEVKLASATSEMSIATKFFKNEIMIALAGSRYVDVDDNAILVTFDIAQEVRGKVNTSMSFVKVFLNEDDFTAQAVSGTSTIIGKPTAYSLEQNYPNPFNPSTTIHYEVPDDGAIVNIVIYNSLGELVKTVVNQVQDAGSFDIVWDGTNDAGMKVGSGIYFYRFNAKGSKEFNSVKKMLLVK